MRMYTRAGNVSSAPGGSPHFESCKDLISSLQALVMHFSLLLGD